MSSAQKVVVLTILKIFNWNEPKNSNLFEVTFTSLKTSTQILSKQLKGKVTSGEVVFNYSLRVAYTPDENQIIVKLSHHQQSRSTFHLLTDFTLNLDHLASKKVQFFPFGKNDKVLKITLGQRDKPGFPGQRAPSGPNQQFIQQKQDFLRRIGTANSNSRLIDNQQRPRKSFSMQTKDLLSQIRSMRQNKPTDNRNGIQYNSNDYHGYEQAKERLVGGNRFSGKVISKSSSYQSLGIASLQPSFRGDGDSSRQSSTYSQKHKLKVKNLEMVPVDSEYYDDYCEPKPVRKSDMLASKAFRYKKQAFRSELY